MARAWLVGGLVAVVGVGAAALLLWRDVGATQDALAEARRALLAGEEALSGDQDAAAALDAFADAEALGRAAQGRVDGPLWSAVGLLPRVGGSVEVGRAAADLAVTSAELGTAVAEQADALLAGDALAGLLDDGRIDLARLDDLATTVDELPVAPVEGARDRMVEVPTGTVVSSLHDEREAAVDMVDGLLTRLDRATTGLDAMRSFLGAEGDRTYLVAAQNPAELRGTGGLIGFMTELRIRDGAIELASGATVQAVEDLIRRPAVDALADLPDPVDRPAAFADRYDYIEAGAFFASVNADPHLPMVAPVLLDLYEQQLGPELDGVVVVDPIALGRIVAATGAPLRLPDGLDTAGLPQEVPGSDLARLVMADGYDAFDGGGPAKKAFDRAVIMAGFDRLAAGGWDPVVMGRTLGEVFASRHMQVFSRDEDEQAAFELLDLAGAMTPGTGATGDVLAVTGVNAGPNKSDVHVAHRISGELALGAVRDTAPGSALRSGTLRVEVENPLRPEDHDIYITGSTEPLIFGATDFRYVDEALNRTWFSIWSTPGTEVRELREQGEQQSFRANNIHGHRVFDYFLSTPSASTNAFELDLEGRVELARDGEDMRYQLTLWRQAKGIPDHWDVTVSPPPGWTVADAQVTGGGQPSGFGPGGDGQPLAAEVEDGAVRLHGAATQDAVLDVTLTRRR